MFGFLRKKSKYEFDSRDDRAEARIEDLEDEVAWLWTQIVLAGNEADNQQVRIDNRLLRIEDSLRRAGFTKFQHDEALWQVTENGAVQNGGVKIPVTEVKEGLQQKPFDQEQDVLVEGIA